MSENVGHLWVVRLIVASLACKPTAAQAGWSFINGHPQVTASLPDLWHSDEVLEVGCSGRRGAKDNVAFERASRAG